MTLAGQRLDPSRYSQIPRTLVFLVDDGHVLLVEQPAGSGAWAGLLNGVGGHIERGEDPLQSAKREVMEETGLALSELRLCGVVMIDTGSSPGIGLFVFVGKPIPGSPAISDEGTARWVRVAHFEVEPLVEDLPVIIPRALECFDGAPPFSAAYHFDDAGRLTITFG